MLGMQAPCSPLASRTPLSQMSAEMMTMVVKRLGAVVVIVQGKAMITGSKYEHLSVFQGCHHHAGLHAYGCRFGNA